MDYLRTIVNWWREIYDALQTSKSAFKDYINMCSRNMSSIRSFLICVYVYLIQKASLLLQN
jgi:hypothetical protein